MAKFIVMLNSVLRVHDVIRLLLFVAAIAASYVAVAPAVKAGSEGVNVQWLGHAAFKLTSTEGKVILIDPFILNNPKTPEKYKDLDKLGNVDVILITHAHGDHIGDALEIARKYKVPVYSPNGLNQTFMALDLLPKDLAPRFNKGGVVMPLGEKIKIIMTRAEHSSEFSWKNPATGKTEMHVGGEPAGFIIEFENGFKVYHMGDTGLFGDMEFIGEYYKPDLLLIPIGGHFVMSPRDAAYASRQYLKPAHAIPMHYGTNPMLKGTVAEYKKAMKGSHINIHDLKPGDSKLFSR